jgi:hypothetical protein
MGKWVKNKGKGKGKKKYQRETQVKRKKFSLRISSKWCLHGGCMAPFRWNSEAAFSTSYL